MRNRIIFYFLLNILIACDAKKVDNSVSEKLPTKSISEVSLGEDKEEIHGLVKDLYEIDKNILIDIDFIDIKYKNVDEKIIVNNNPKIRTYKIDSLTIIYSKDCKNLKANELLQIKTKILQDTSVIVVGNSKGGKMIDINFGCYD